MLCIWCWTISACLVPRYDRLLMTLASSWSAPAVLLTTHRCTISLFSTNRSPDGIVRIVLSVEWARIFGCWTLPPVCGLNLKWHAALKDSSLSGAATACLVPTFSTSRPSFGEIVLNKTSQVPWRPKILALTRILPICQRRENSKRPRLANAKTTAVAKGKRIKGPKAGNQDTTAESKGRVP